jgi:hypothetical protein
MSEMSELDLRRQRAAKNQSLFREVNERIEDLAGAGAFSLFVCECMDEGCDGHVSLTVEEYEQVRAHSNRFIVLPGHDVPGFDVVLASSDRYLVVSKLGEGAIVAGRLDPRKRDSPNG